MIERVNIKLVDGWIYCKHFAVKSVSIWIVKNELGVCGKALKANSGIWVLREGAASAPPNG